MNEASVKKQLLHFLSERAPSFSSTSYLEELRVAGGKAIADVVSLTNDIECYEIKSSADNLKRIVRQGWQYGRVFDYVTLVADTKHIPSAIKVIPDWWGILEVDQDLNIALNRESCKNPYQEHRGIAEVFSRGEIEALLDSVGALRGYKSKNLKMLQARLTEIFCIDDLKMNLKEALFKRASIQV